MMDLSEKLSAYLDGELSADAAAEIEALLAQDAATQAEFDALLEADALAQSGFDAVLRDPVPLSLAQSIRAAPMPLALAMVLSVGFLPSRGRPSLGGFDLGIGASPSSHRGLGPLSDPRPHVLISVLQKTSCEVNLNRYKSIYNDLVREDKS